MASGWCSATTVARLCVTGEPGDRPAARLGDEPTRCFADVWARLQNHPFDVDGDRVWRVVDAQLRRIQSWSVALQFIEEFPAVHGVGSRDCGGCVDSGGDDGGA